MQFFIPISVEHKQPQITLYKKDPKKLGYNNEIARTLINHTDSLVNKLGAIKDSDKLHFCMLFRHYLLKAYGLEDKDGYNPIEPYFNYNQVSNLAKEFALVCNINKNILDILLKYEDIEILVDEELYLNAAFDYVILSIPNIEVDDISNLVILGVDVEGELNELKILTSDDFLSKFNNEPTEEVIKEELPPQEDKVKLNDKLKYHIAKIKNYFTFLQ